jgi:hypothetical protein
MRIFIPQGLYCYEIKRVVENKQGFIIKTRICNYYDGENEKCKLLGVDILDQCKECDNNLLILKDK